MVDILVHDPVKQFSIVIFEGVGYRFDTGMTETNQVPGFSPAGSTEMLGKRNKSFTREFLNSILRCTQLTFGQERQHAGGEYSVFSDKRQVLDIF